MWPKNYKDYPAGSFLKQNQVQPLYGVVGCEMHEYNGWRGMGQRSRAHEGSSEVPNTHTWPLYLHYYSCPACGIIIENQEPYQKVRQEMVKVVCCCNCQAEFIVKALSDSQTE